MKNIKKKWDLLSEAKRKEYTDAIATFMSEDIGEDIGVFAAEDVLDFFLEKIGPEIYNKGVEDSQDITRSHFSDLEVDLELLFNK